MCRHQIEAAWDGRMYDCDFNLALGLPIGDGKPALVRDFDPGRYVVEGSSLENIATVARQGMDRHAAEH